MDNEEKKPQIEIDGAAIFETATALLKEIKHRTGMTVEKLVEKLEEESALPEARTRAILYPEAQGAHYLSLVEIRKVAKYGLSVFPKDSEENGARAVRQLCTDLASKIYENLNVGVISPGEYVFRSKLKIDPARQSAFSRMFAGVYANIRFSQSGYLGITRMDVRAHTEGAVLCRFVTRRLSQGARHERVVRGYMYEADDGAIHALGCIEGTGLFRTTVLKPFASSDSAAPDLYGLRLSVSDLDDGPFASRLYCKRLLGRKSEDDLKGWEEIFKSHPYNKKALELIGKQIHDIERITNLLRERHKKAKPWGVAFPEGVSE